MIKNPAFTKRRAGLVAENAYCQHDEFFKFAGEVFFIPDFI